jgi:hypothetical protein
LTPDPTLATIEMLDRKVADEARVIMAKLDGLDKLTVERFHRIEQAAGERDQTSRRAIDKAERLARDAVRTQGELAASTTDALAERVARLEEISNAITSSASGARQAYAGLYMLAGFIALVVAIVGGVIAATA